MKIRRLNEQGIANFETFIYSFESEQIQNIPYNMLSDDSMTESLGIDIEIKNIIFRTRFNAAEYLYTLFEKSGLKSVESDRGLWSWLSLFYFEQLCPGKGKTRQKPGNIARWIPATRNFRRYYRHLLAGPYRIYRTHRDNPERAMILLCGPLSAPGDIVEQLASRQEIITNKGIVETATLLYYDKKSGKPKRGAAGKGAGSCRRLVSLMGQLDLTWDLYTMTSTEILSMLAGEFNIFIPSSR